MDLLVASEPPDVTQSDSGRQTLQHITSPIANPETPEQNTVVVFSQGFSWAVTQC